MNWFEKNVLFNCRPRNEHNYPSELYYELTQQQVHKTPKHWLENIITPIIFQRFLQNPSEAGQGLILGGLLTMGSRHPVFQIPSWQGLELQ